MATRKQNLKPARKVPKTAKKTAKRSRAKSTKAKSKRTSKSTKTVRGSIDNFIAELTKSPNVHVLTKAESAKIMDNLVINGCIAIPKGTVLPDGTIVDETWHKPWNLPSR
jgi:BRCT domain type II-containing protein